jgi:hypothetical protein
LRARLAVGAQDLVLGGPPLRIGVELRRSAVGPVPRLVRDRLPPVPLVVAVPALALATQQPVEKPTAVALTIEGLLGWYRDDGGLQPPQQAVAYALHCAPARLEEAGRPAPGALVDAIAAHRRVAPMAGGA